MTDTQISSENSSVSKFPEIMGILNITPDSFSDGGRFFDYHAAFMHAEKMIEQGADIIDIGGESSRPFSEPVEINDELDRVIPVIIAIKKKYPTIKLSIDTVKYEVALAAIQEGADIINDISGLNNDVRLAELAGRFNKSLILMHMLGSPSTMQNNPVYQNVTYEVLESLKAKISIAKNYGVKDIIIDPGIGFGKTVAHNLELLRNLDKFKFTDSRLLLGISRKSFIGKSLDIELTDDRDIPTALFHALLLDKKADIIRVHNVGMISQLKRIYHLLY